MHLESVLRETVAAFFLIEKICFHSTAMVAATSFQPILEQGYQVITL